MIRWDVIWEGGGHYRLPCLECGESFSTKRRDAVYCGATCRQRANRRKKRLIQDAHKVVDQIRRLRQLETKRPDLQAEVDRALKIIESAWQ